MSTEFKQVQSIFLAALEKPANDWGHFLQGKCAGDSELRQQVEALLQAHALGEGMLDNPVQLPTIDMPSPSERVGTQIGPYKLVEQIGEGGMGMVYMAEQKEPVRRTVALKLIKRGMDTDQVVARFEAERQALALMNHPNIARVLDAGATDDGRPYFVMDLVRGIPVTEYCNQKKFSPRERLELFVTVCLAVQHAHQKGVIHRDLKPSNILVELHDVTHVPKVIDFGVAKATSQRLTERTLVTQFSQMIGTPLYMSPEQAELSGLDVDTRSDIYSLGVLLYELLTGTTPFDRETFHKASLDEMRRMIREDDPPRPSHRISTLNAERLSTLAERQRADAKQLRRLVERELDWIVMKALEKDRTRRYESASAFAEDVRRHLSNEPVAACPPSIRYRASKVVRQYRVALATFILIAAALSIGSAISTWQAFEAHSARQIADNRLVEVEDQRKQAEDNLKAAQAAQHAAERQEAEVTRQRNIVYRNLYHADMRLGMADWRSGNIARLTVNLNGHMPHEDRADLRAWEWFYLLSLCHSDAHTIYDHQGQHYIRGVSWSPDGRSFASSSDRGGRELNFWDATTWEAVGSFGKAVRGFAWSPDGKLIAGATHVDESVRVWDLHGEELVSFRGHTYVVQRVAWHPEGKRLASCAMDGTIRIWDIDSEECVHVLEGHTDHVNSIAWSPDGGLLASVGGSDGLKIWNAGAGEVINSVQEGSYSLNSVSWSPDGELLVLGGRSGGCFLVDADSLKLVRELSGHTGRVVTAISPEGSELASGGAEGFIKVWDLVTGRCVRTFRGHRGAVVSICWNPDGRRLATGSKDELVKIWDLDARPCSSTFQAHSGGVANLTWLDNGRLLACTSDEDRAASLWIAATGKRVAVRSGLGSPVAWNSDGQLLASLDPLHAVVRIVQEETGKETRILDTQRLNHGGQTPVDVRVGLAWSPDGAKLARWKTWNALQVWDLKSNQICYQTPLWQEGEPGPGLETKANTVAWNSDGSRLAIAGWGGPMRGAISLLDTVTWKRLWSTPTDSQASSISWSRDEQKLAAGTIAGELHVLDAGTGQPLSRSSMHSSRVNSLDWTPDGLRLVSASDDHSVKVIDSWTGTELLSLEGHTAPVTAVRVRPDGRALAAASSDGTVTIWDASRGYQFVSSEGFRRERAVLHFEQARQLALVGRQSEAIQLLEKLAEAFDGSPDYRPPLARRLSAAGEHDMAAVIYERLTDDYPEAREYQQLLNVESATGLIKESRLDEAHSILQELIKGANILEQPEPESEVEDAIVRLSTALATAYERRGGAAFGNGDFQTALRDLESACRAAPNRANAHNNLAWYLATCPQIDYRNVTRAVELATRAVELAPDRGIYWNTLGVAQYRGEDWQASSKALTESMRLRDGGDGFDWIFMAMAHWRLGEQEEARQWYDKALRWMTENKSTDEELVRFRAEAEALLEVAQDGE